MKKIIGITLLSTILGSGTVQAGQQQYGYCSTSYGESTNLKYVVSSVFKIRNDVYHVGVENSFRSYVNAEFGALSDSPNCSIRYDSYQDAADERNDLISEYRNEGKDFRTVHWSYRGD